MKKSVLIITFLFASLFAFSQEKSANTLFTIGHTFKNDISLSIGGKVDKDKDLYISYDHSHNFDTKHQGNYIAIGIGNQRQIIAFRYGAITMPYEGSHIHKTDYGIEYLWIYPRTDRNLAYGLSYTKHMGFGIKAGLLF